MLPGALSPCNKREESLISLDTFQLSSAHASVLALAPLRSRGGCTSLPRALPQESPSHRHTPGDPAKHQPLAGHSQPSDMLGWFRCCWLGFLKQQLANYGPRDTGELKKADEFFRWKSEADIWQTRTIFKGCESFTEFKIIRCASSEKSLADYTKHTIKWR